MSYLEKLTKFFEIYIIIMLTICAILLTILVYNTSRSNVNYHGIVDQLSRLELVEYGEN